jgi:hypothetical protein
MSRVAFLLVALAVACRSAPPAAPLPLHEGTAAQLRRAFDDARDRPRLIVALSPT